MRHFFRTLINLIQAILFLLIGAMALVLPWSVRLRDIATGFIQERPIALFFIGLAFFSIGIALIVAWRHSTKNRVYYVRTGKKSVAVDEQLVDAYLKTYWKERFPEHEIESQVSLHHHQLQLLVHFPPIPKEQQKKILTQIQNEIEELLTSHLGYHEPFRLMATFGE